MRYLNDDYLFVIVCLGFYVLKIIGRCTGNKSSVERARREPFRKEEGRFVKLVLSEVLCSPSSGISLINV